MPGITRVLFDTAGGQILTTPNNDFARVEGYLWAQVGATIASHGDSPHDAATMAQGSNFAKINGVAGCFAGNQATCGDVATGSTSMRVSQ